MYSVNPLDIALNIYLPILKSLINITGKIPDLFTNIVLIRDSTFIQSLTTNFTATPTTFTTTPSSITFITVIILTVAVTSTATYVALS